jgi:hypothetical protein
MAILTAAEQTAINNILTQLDNVRTDLRTLGVRLGNLPSPPQGMLLSVAGADIYIYGVDVELNRLLRLGTA